MKIIKAKNRMEAMEKAPKAKIMRRRSKTEYEAFDDKDDYYNHELAAGKRVDKRWLASREAKPHAPQSCR